MINLDNIKSSKLEEFSTQRKNLLRLITQGVKIDKSVIKPILKNIKGGLYQIFLKFSKSEQNLENIYDLIQKITLDESELSQVEKSLIKNGEKTIQMSEKTYRK
jgi:hypothetical protein